jgi:hypothetical protein
MTNFYSRISFVLLLLAALLSGLHFYLATYHTLLIGFADIDVFLYTVMNYLRNGILYPDREPLALTYEAGRSILKFPPLYVVPYLPWVDAAGIDKKIYQLLFSVHVLRYLLVFLLCGFFLGPYKNIRWWTLMVIIFSLCAPFYESLYGLTFDNLYLFLLALALVLIRLRQKLLPILLITYAANAKLYPLMQLIPFLIAKNWRMVIYCIGFLLLWLAIAVGIFGFAPHEFYFFRILPVLLHEDVLCETGNLAIAAKFCSFQKWFVVLKIFFIISTLFVAVLSTKKIHRGNEDSRFFDEQGLLYAFIVCLPLLVMQNVWGNYQLILLVPICALLGYAFIKTGSARHIAMSAALLAWFPLLVSDNYPAMDIFYYAWLGADLPRLMIDQLKPYSVLVLWLALGFLLLWKNNPGKTV